MWSLNVVIIITFLFFIINVIQRATKQKQAYLYLILIISVALEAVLVCNIFEQKQMNNILQILVLIFSYLIPMFVTFLNTAKVSFKLKILYAVAKVAYALKKYEFAAGILKGAIQNDKNNVDFYYLRSKALEKLGDLAGARDMLFKVVELDRENIQMYLELAQILDRENKKDTALVMLAHALKIAPEYAPAKEMMGIIYSEIGRDKEALSIYEELATSGDGTYNTYYNLAIIYWRNNKIDEAIKAYNIAVSLNAKLYEAYYALGTLHFIEENYEQSIYNLEKALKDDILEAKALYLLAQNYIKQNDLEQASECLNDAVKLDIEYLKKAKQNNVFDAIDLEIKRLEDENKELITETYDLKEV